METQFKKFLTGIFLNIYSPGREKDLPTEKISILIKENTEFGKALSNDVEFSYYEDKMFYIMLYSILTHIIKNKKLKSNANAKVSSKQTTYKNLKEILAMSDDEINPMFANIHKNNPTFCKLYLYEQITGAQTEKLIKKFIVLVENIPADHELMYIVDGDDWYASQKFIRSWNPNNIPPNKSNSSGSNSEGGKPKKNVKKTKVVKKTEVKKEYKKLSKKHTDKDGVSRVVYKKGDKEYVKKKSSKTGKFYYKHIN